jgi:hypothetical protein
VKRCFALACWSLVVLSPVEFAPAAGAVGLGVCRISGTIVFSSRTAGDGQWSIVDGIIDCQGLIAARRRILAPGPFKGSGSFTALPDGGGTCLHQAGSGTVDYRIPTSGGDILITEPDAYTLAGAASFTTPTLRGTFELPPPYDGDCLTRPVTRAPFVAQALLYRYPRELPTPPGPPSLVPRPEPPEMAA